MPTYKATINDLTFDLTAEQLKQLDSVPDSDDSLHVLLDNKAYKVEARHLGRKQYEVVVNGNKYVVQLADDNDLLVERLGLSVRAAAMAKEIVAPMPGLVLSIEVEAGQEVTKGNPLLILEAMKMENVIKAAGDGIVKSISVAQGTAVEKGTVLLEFE